MRIFIVGDLAGHLTNAAQILIAKGGKVTQISSSEDALRLMRGGQSCDILLMDILLDLTSFIKNLKKERIHCLIVACGLGEVNKEKILEAIRAGAKEYIPLPPDAKLIAGVLEALIESNDQIIFQDPAMKEVVTLAQKVAPSEASILITGESGTGKEVIARYIHQKSFRKDKPFISVNCAAIPENLLESELFGHEKGAFTGALSRRIGKFEEASGGTLLLDEISEMHPRLQAKLLRAIQEREIDRVGGSSPVKVNIRILSTSNREMEEEIEQGHFRGDLYFRLNVVNIKVPSLRERLEDIKVLAKHFLKKYIEVNGFSPKKISDDCLKTLQTYDWPGNVRELENTMHRAVLLSPKEIIEVEHLRLKSPSSTELPPSLEIGQTLAEMERNFILSTVDHCIGDHTQAAHLLGLSLRSLREKLKEYGKSHGFEPDDTPPHAIGSV
jgi:DNA-binding NtrC family response regulator